MKKFLIPLTLFPCLLAAQIASTNPVRPAQVSAFSPTTTDFSICALYPISSGTFTVTLPATAPPSGQCLRLRNEGSGVITINPNGLLITGKLTIQPGATSAPNDCWITSTGSGYEVASMSIGPALVSSVGYTIPLSTGTSYAPLTGVWNSITTIDANVQAPLGAIAGTIANLQVVVGNALSSGQTLVVTLLDNGVQTGVTCTVPALGSTCSDTTHSYTIPAGDLTSWQIAITNGNGSSTIAIAAQVRF